MTSTPRPTTGDRWFWGIRGRVITLTRAERAGDDIWTISVFIDDGRTPDSSVTLKGRGRSDKHFEDLCAIWT